MKGFPLNLKRIRKVYTSVNAEDLVDTIVQVIEDIDTIPPESISNFILQDKTSSWLNFTWTNPHDTDFNHTEIYLNGIFQTDTSVEYFNATELQPETDYTISTRTVDINGNVNEAWVNSTATTDKKFVPDVEKPVSGLTGVEMNMK